MSFHSTVRPEYADTVAATLPVVRLHFGPAATRSADDDADDWTLLRLVACVAAATLVLALASSLAG